MLARAQAGLCRVWQNLRKLVLLSDGLGAEVLLNSNGVVGTALDGAVVGDNDASDALDDTDTGDDAAGGDLSLGVQLVTSHGRQLHECRAGVDERGDSVAGQHLLAGEVLGACLFRAAQLDLGGEVLHLRHDLGHLLLVLLVLVRRDVDVALDSGNGGGLVRRAEVGDAAHLTVDPAKLTAQAHGLLRGSREGHCVYVAMRKDEKKRKER